MGTVLNRTYFSDGQGSTTAYAPRLIEGPGLWLPRWFDSASIPQEFSLPSEGRVDGTADVLTAWYRAFYQETTKLKENSANNSINFYLPVGLPRQGYILPFCDYSKPLTLTNLGSGHVYGTIEKVNSEEDLLSTTSKPVFYADNQKTILKNLALVEYSLTTTSSGFLDLAPYLTADPAIEDSLIICANYYGDYTYFQPDEVIARGGKLIVIEPGTYKIRYESTRLKTSLLSNANISNNGLSYTPKQFDFSNLIDYWANSLGLSRLGNESNLSLRCRCQNIALSSTVEQILNAGLGLSDIKDWDTSSSLTLSASSFHPSFLTVDYLAPYEESPKLIDAAVDYLTISRPAYGPVTLFLDDNIIHPKYYDVINYNIYPKLPVLLNIETTRLKVKYRAENYSSRYTVSGLVLTPQTITQKFVPGTVPYGVYLETGEKKYKHYSWGRPFNLIKGNSFFDGALDLVTDGAIGPDHSYWVKIEDTPALHADSLWAGGAIRETTPTVSTSGSGVYAPLKVDRYGVTYIDSGVAALTPRTGTLAYGSLSTSSFTTIVSNSNKGRNVTVLNLTNAPIAVSSDGTNIVMFVGIGQGTSFDVGAEGRFWNTDVTIKALSTPTTGTVYCTIIY